MGLAAITFGIPYSGRGLSPKGVYYLPFCLSQSNFASWLYLLKPWYGRNKNKTKCCCCWNIKSQLKDGELICLSFKRKNWKLVESLKLQMAERTAKPGRTAGASKPPAAVLQSSVCIAGVRVLIRKVQQKQCCSLDRERLQKILSDNSQHPHYFYTFLNIEPIEPRAY